MYDDSGFTLIEVVFTISIILILSTITLHFVINSKPVISLQQQCQQVISLLEEGKSRAMINHEQINIIIQTKQISYNGQKDQRTLTINDNYYIDDYYEFHFNHNGNISSGGHLKICSSNGCKMLEVEHFMLNKQGMTLIETLMAFSIFISIIVLFLSCYNNAINHHYQINQDYTNYLKQQQEKEVELWQTSGLNESVNEVLH